MRARQALNPLLAFAFAVAVLCSTSAWAQLEQQPTNFEAEEAAKEAAKKKPPQLTKLPELLEAADPIYPEDAWNEGRGGVVVMFITIGKDGFVDRVQIKESAGEDLDWAALGAVTNFIFSPAEFDGKPGAVAIEYQTVFEVTQVVEEVATDEALAAEEELAEVAVGETGPINFEGVVREAGSKVNLDGVEVSVEIELPAPEGVDVADPDYIPPLDVRTTYTDDEGRFAFRGVPLGRHKIAYAMSGYEPSFSVEEFKDGERTQAVIYLTPWVSNEFETVVRERRARKEVAKVSLSREEVRRIPGTFGDPLRVVENLPGLARAPFIGGALIVRGANPADTGVYFDGVPIPILYHFGGLKSVVNAEFLEDISFYPGGFPAYYGRATAGIVDVRSRSLKMNNFRGFAEVSVLDTSFFFGGPIEIEGLPKITIAAAARRSYIDALIPLALDIFVPGGSQGVIAAPVYWDYQLKMETEPIPGQRFSIFAFGSDDDLKVLGGAEDESFNLGLKQGFHRLVGRWTSRFPGGITHMVQPFIGLNNQGVNADADLGVSLALGIATWNWGLRDELRFKPNDIFEVAVGADYLGNTYAFNFDIPLPLEIGSFPRVYPRLPPENTQIKSSGMINNIGFYTEGIFSPIEAIKIVPSIRAELSHFYFQGQENLDGTKDDDAFATVWNVDPRITARVSPLKGTTLKGAFGLYRQPPSEQQINPFSGNPNLDAPRAWQFIGGIEQVLTEDINIDFQLYMTWRDLIPQSTGDIVTQGDGQIQRIAFTNGGFGRTFGAEVLLRHEITKYFFGWIAYTLSRSEIDTSESRDSFVLTGFDQTHILTLVGQVNVMWGFTVGGRFRLVSGNPTTTPVGSINDLDTGDYQALNQPQRSERLPYFHQLDIRVDRKFIFDNFTFTPYLDLLNVYYPVRAGLNAYVDPRIAPNNAEAFQNDFRSRQRQQIDSLPIVPNFGIQGEF